MSTTTLTKTAREIVAAATSNVAGGTTRGTLDLRTAMGGLLTLKITNGATGPTTQCVCTVHVAHNDGATPAAGAEGADWKRIFRVGGGTSNNGVTHQSYEFGPGVMHMQVEFTGNTGQAVTVEAYVSEITSANSA
ncbi:MAG: hypothetical protein ACOZB0_04550 [Pseudomonadota bacterium]